MPGLILSSSSRELLLSSLSRALRIASFRANDADNDDAADDILAPFFFVRLIIFLDELISRLSLNAEEFRITRLPLPVAGLASV
jgi:hypothetical protein